MLTVGPIMHLVVVLTAVLGAVCGVFLVRKVVRVVVVVLFGLMKCAGMAVMLVSVRLVRQRPLRS